ncbi:hypothetical protein ACGF12_34340 [Kitasatospora sp. NPDC048296]|uniref:hypothetical protein n=1 Tax=Kitasatospora sp. NPDC048296 TaxID=3364048 RepID=UPI0037102111
MPVPPSLSAAYGVIDAGHGARLFLGTLSLHGAQRWIEELHLHARACGYVMDDESRSLTAQVLARFRAPAISGDGVHVVRKELE